MKKIQVTKRILALKFNNRHDVASAFLRFQEHYESPKFKNKIFTLGEYHSWYSEEYGGATYYEDWDGFNVPDYIFKPFIQGLFDPLNEAEQKIIALIRYRTDKFYLLGIHEQSDVDTMDHEIAHGLYYTEEKYRQQVDALLAKHDLTVLESHLKNIGYHEDVLRDECHAYISASSDHLRKEGVDFPKDLQKPLRKLWEKFIALEMV